MSELRQAAQAALDALESDAIQRTFAGGVRISNAAIALRAALAQPPAPTAQPAAYWIPKAEQFCIAKSGERPFAKAWEPLYAQPVQQPGADVHWCATWLRNNYQDHPSISGLCDAMKEAANQAAPAQRQPLTPSLRRAAEFTRADLGPAGSNYPHVRELLAFAEQALGITAATAAQKGEKL